MSGEKNILMLPGDGVGPEVSAQAEAALCAVAEKLQLRLSFSHARIGGVAVDNDGEPLPPATLEAARRADAVFLGAVGGPQYDSLPRDKRPERGLLGIRRALDAFANLRPAKCHPALAAASPLRAELVSGLDILIVRELTGGIYFGEPRGVSVEDGVRVGVNTLRYDEREIARVCRVAFRAAQVRGGKVCSVDKSNVLESSALWREVAEEVAKEFPAVSLSHMLVDNAAMQLARSPKQFDVIVTGNLFGDILSDEAAMLTGSIGMLPSASLNESGGGLFEPVHGAAPDIAGRDIANPLAAILSAAMMLRHSLSAPAAADVVESAVGQALDDGLRCADIAAEGESAVGCAAMGSAVVDNIHAARV